MFGSIGKNKVHVERREEKWGPEWSFENSKNTTILGKPWYLKLSFDSTNQTPFELQYYSIIKYHSIVSKLQKYYASKQGLIVAIVYSFIPDMCACGYCIV